MYSEIRLVERGKSGILPLPGPPSSSKVVKQGGEEGDAWTAVDESKSEKYSDDDHSRADHQNTNIVHYKVRPTSLKYHKVV